MERKAESILMLACDQCLFLVRRQRNRRSSVRSCRNYIAPQIASEVKEIQRPAKITFNQNELRVIMRLLV
jgi:hypothetical protein